MDSNGTNTSIHLIEKIASEYSRLAEDAVLAHISINLTNFVATSNEAFRVDGVVLILLVKGSLRINVNFNEFDMHGPSVLTLHHGSLVNIISDSEEDEIDMYVLWFSPSFIQNLNVSFSAISDRAIHQREIPGIEVSDREISTLIRYFSLIRSAMNDSYNLQLSRHIVSSLTAALVYQLLLFVYKQYDATAESDQTTMSPSRRSYVHDFIKLVHQHYTTERSVNFYASKLFISPKYLSLLVKEATGQSATKWIDLFVITEAKNLLRYSGKNIQQVAYALNFSNQSSFGKYFKHLTGMSPTEFQKS
ncbi:MAG: helix-turn-helix domain-containing protein [Muribaculaceae bacterium]|nr:helix-turn-helix domain-containing protein [Muribaculaceae bacterium]